MTAEWVFDGSSVGLKSVKSGDMVLVPIYPPDSLIRSGRCPTLSFICNPLEADTKQLFARDPRQDSAPFMRYHARHWYCHRLPLGT
jgi:glutamine synthetase